MTDTRKQVYIGVPNILLREKEKRTMTRSQQLLLPSLVSNSKAGIPNSNFYAGSWLFKQPPVDGKVIHEATGLGTPRPPEPRRCLELNGTNQYGWIDVDTVNYPFTLFGFAISDLTNTRWLVSLSDPSNSTRYFTFGYDNGDLISIGRRNTIETSNSQAVDLVDGWASYVVCFVDATTVEVYRNGMLLHTFSGITSVPAGAGLTRFSVGTFRTLSPAGNWSGKAMHCGFLRRAATLADAQTFHTTGIIPDAEVLLPLDGNSTTVAHNIGTSAAHWLEEPRRNLLTYTEAINPENGWTINGTGVETDYPGEGRGLNVSRSVAGAGFGLSAVKTVALLGATAGTVHTFQIRARRVSGPATVTIRGIESGGANADEGSDSGMFTLTSEFQTITFSRTIVRNDRTGIRFFIASTEAGDYVVDTVLPQVELGNTATDYQPVLRTGIDYPEATIVNGAAGMLYEGRDVPFSRQNEVGFSERTNLLESTSVLNVTPWSGAVRDTAVLQPDGGWKLVGFSDAAGVRLSQQQEGSPLTTYTAQVEVRAEGTDIGKAFLLMLIRSGLTTSVLEQTVVNLTADYQLVTVTWTGLADTEGYQIRFNFPTGGADAPIVRNPQVELGSVATSYQRIDSDPGTSVRIPALLSDSAKSAATDTLTYTGKAHFDGTLEQSNCLTFDGVDDYISMDLADVAGPELVPDATLVDTTGWAIDGLSWTINSGSFTCDNTSDASQSRIKSPTVCQQGKFYLVEFNMTAHTGSDIRVDMLPDSGSTGSTAHASFSGVGVHRCVVANTGSNTRACLRVAGNAAPATATIEDFSVRELPTVIGDRIETQTSVTAVPVGGPVTTLYSIGTAVIGVAYEVSLEVQGYTGTGTVGFTSGASSAFDAVVGRTRGSDGPISFTAVATGTLLTLFSRDTNTCTFANISIREVGLVDNDGTSLLTYRPEGDGINGTAGTAYNIRLGDVEHIPCSEGAGDFVHGTKLNQAYPIVNGQASNWEDKQNDYNYNITKGATKIDTSVSENFDPSTLVLSSETSIGIDPSDFTHLFQDHRGTVPVTQVGDPIGLAIDKQQGGLNNPGPELVTNGGFDSLTGWNTGVGWSISDGKLNASVTGFTDTRTPYSFLSGKTYKCEFDLDVVSGGMRLQVAGSQTATITTSGHKTVYLTGATTGSLAVIGYGASGAFTGTIDNISVREIPGYHLSQTDNAKRPILSRTPEGGVRQLLQWSEDLTGSSWLQIGATRPSATVMRETATTGVHYVYQTGNLNAGNHVLRVTCKYDGRQWIRVHSFRGVTRAAYFDLQNGVVGAETSVVDASITDVGDGFYECQIVFDVAAAGSGDWGFRTAIADGNDNFAGDAALGVIFRDAQLEEGTTPTPYQKATTRFDITEAGKRDCWAIGFPGNAALSTPASVDMSGSDEMVVCAGVRKLSDAATGTLIESSSNVASFNGAFLLRAPWVVAPGYGWASNGTSLTQATVGANYVAPVSNVLTGIGDISGDISRLRINGTQVSESLDDQGTGNYGNHRIYFGARAESSLYFNGLMYSCVIINRLLTEFERERLENWSAYKQGAANFHIIEPLYIPASETSPGFDSLENPLTNPAIVGHNGAETEINYSPVDNSWPEQYSIPGADLPNYTFDGDPGDIVLGVDTATREAKFRLEK